jgi:hypothetical protein
VGTLSWDVLASEEQKLLGLDDLVGISAKYDSSGSLNGDGITSGSSGIASHEFVGSSRLGGSNGDVLPEEVTVNLGGARSDPLTCFFESVELIELGL